MERCIKTWPELRSTGKPSNSGVLLSPPWARPRWPLGRTWPPLNYRPLGGRPGRGRRNEHTDFYLLPSLLHVKLRFLLNPLSGWKAPPCTWLTKSRTWASFCISLHSTSDHWAISPSAMTLTSYCPLNLHCLSHTSSTENLLAKLLN